MTVIQDQEVPDLLLTGYIVFYIATIVMICLANASMIYILARSDPFHEEKRLSTTQNFSRDTHILKPDILKGQHLTPSSLCRSATRRRKSATPDFNWPTEATDKPELSMPNFSGGELTSSFQVQNCLNQNERTKVLISITESSHGQFNQSSQVAQKTLYAFQTEQKTSDLSSPKSKFHVAFRESLNAAKVDDMILPRHQTINYIPRDHRLKSLSPITSYHRVRSHSMHILDSYWRRVSSLKTWTDFKRRNRRFSPGIMGGLNTSNVCKYLFSLSSAYLIRGAAMIPLFLVVTFFSVNFNPYTRCNFYLAVMFFNNLTGYCCAYSQLGIAIDRFRAIVTPFKRNFTHLQSQLAIAFIWVFSTVAAIPTIVILQGRKNHYYLTQDAKNFCQYRRNEHLLMISLQMSIGCGFPVLACCVLYGIVIFRLWSGAQKFKTPSDAKDAGLKTKLLVKSSIPSSGRRSGTLEEEATSSPRFSFPSPLLLKKSLNGVKRILLKQNALTEVPNRDGRVPSIRLSQAPKDAIPPTHAHFDDDPYQVIRLDGRKSKGDGNGTFPDGTIENYIDDPDALLTKTPDRSKRDDTPNQKKLISSLKYYNNLKSTLENLVIFKISIADGTSSLGDTFRNKVNSASSATPNTTKASNDTERAQRGGDGLPEPTRSRTNTGSQRSISDTSILDANSETPKQNLILVAPLSTESTRPSIRSEKTTAKNYRNVFRFSNQYRKKFLNRRQTQEDNGTTTTKTALSASSLRRNRNAIKMVVIILILYTICSIPFYVMTILEIASKDLRISFILEHFHNILIMTDHWLHVGVYLYFNASFREAFVRIFIKPLLACVSKAIPEPCLVRLKTYGGKICWRKTRDTKNNLKFHRENTIMFDNANPRYSMSKTNGSLKPLIVKENGTDKSREGCNSSLKQLNTPKSEHERKNSNYGKDTVSNPALSQITEITTLGASKIDDDDDNTTVIENKLHRIRPNGLSKRVKGNNNCSQDNKIRLPIPGSDDENVNNFSKAKEQKQESSGLVNNLPKRKPVKLKPQLSDAGNVGEVKTKDQSSLKTLARDDFVMIIPNPLVSDGLAMRNDSLRNKCSDKDILAYDLNGKQSITHFLRLVEGSLPYDV